MTNNVSEIKKLLSMIAKSGSKKESSVSSESAKSKKVENKK